MTSRSEFSCSAGCDANYFGFPPHLSSCGLKGAVGRVPRRVRPAGTGATTHGFTLLSLLNLACRDLTGYAEMGPRSPASTLLHSLSLSAGVLLEGQDWEVLGA